jgi:hypothetical protein
MTFVLAASLRRITSPYSPTHTHFPYISPASGPAKVSTEAYVCVSFFVLFALCTLRIGLSHADPQSRFLPVSTINTEKRRKLEALDRIVL